ncbi:PREDICTED: sodium/potassium-transporting ATPase subunit beta-1 [Rhagoletis zephyria]|uniref:sodium/potassium-transporting ATPase subunit beta-1 n=1 Tax=Rhagoletis zephyria TaxID=28612 RepID=UPI0008117362|nr:PREDICTED: sodium/potassium-transporting ATPase subunit beta-1 [Rhagoletis zephyria]XP_017473813.1 PREDICTED: sodium/potassium-transporting ATPase subunit beta-1 [Rhagoletis zephyria]XP_017473820.1 PREDICTED: sodium/potassium-transporting ATPase subunit beta-1 [Rhagoletis zephyria]
MATKKNGNAVTEFQFPQRKEKQTWLEIVYNKKNGTYFGRTPKSWGQLMLFYTIFYIVLAAMFAICMQGLFASLSDKEPTWKLEGSLIGTNPGLGFRPLSDETERGSVIQFDTKKPEEGRYWQGLIDQFLEKYRSTGQKKICQFNQTRNANQVCVVDVNSFGPCSQQNAYGYQNGRPCIFLKLNKIFNWQPQFFDNIKELPKEMPTELKEHIGNLTDVQRQQVWVSCNGLHPVDKEAVGEMKFYPGRGFPAYYYPYLNQPGYVSPLVAVQFEKLKQNQLVNIECRAWAKNVIYSGSLNARTGSVTFQLFVD